MRSRSAHSLSLVRYSAFIAWGGNVRRFHQLILSVSHQGKAAAMTAWRLAARPPARSSFRPSARPAARVLVSPLCSSFIVHPCRSKQEAAFFIYPIVPACLAPSNLPSPLPRCLIRFAHPSRPSSRLASRRPSRSHIASSHRLVLIPFLSCPMCRTLTARLAVAPFCPAHLVIIPMLCRPCRPCRLMPG